MARLMEYILWAIIFILGMSLSITLMLWDIARQRYEDDDE